MQDAYNYMRNEPVRNVSARYSSFNHRSFSRYHQQDFHTDVFPDVFNHQHRGDKSMRKGIVIVISFVFLLFFYCSCAHITYDNGKGQKINYWNWKKFSVSYRNPQTGEILDVSSDPSPWAQSIRDAFTTGIEMGKLMGSKENK